MRQEGSEELAARAMVASYAEEYGRAVLKDSLLIKDDSVHTRFFPIPAAEMAISLLAAQLWDEPHIMNHPAQLHSIMPEVCSAVHTVGLEIIEFR